MSKEQFTLLPLTLPADAPKILRLHYQQYLSYLPQNPITEEEFVSSRFAQTLSRFSNPGNLMGKLVLSDDHEKVASYIIFSPPGPPDERTDEEKERDLRKEIDGAEGLSDKELVFRLKSEDRRLNEKFFGKGYESRFWELLSLVTDVSYQRKGLGSRLVEWGLNHVEGMVRRSEGRLEGCYLIANPAGDRTYRKAGFEMVGERSTELDEKYRHCWFIKRFV